METTLGLHMLQHSRFVRETPVFVMGLPCCRENKESPAKIKLQHLYYNNNIVIIFML